ncbi:MAG: hypothetical protein EX269_06565 [Acidimicrobiales bacterium]|nr:MAG: hypothetical protein EX269_06565 [Acidimicrobiales bacterium]
MIASLPMYARPELEAAHARYWVLIRDGLRKRGMTAPDRLTLGADERDTWHDPGLVLSQTCGLPYRRWLHGSVQLVGTPDYGVDGCPAGWYRSAVICRKDERASTLAEFCGSVLAFNSEDSESGFSAIMSQADRQGVAFGDRIKTGAHLRSADAVAQGKAELAAIDAVSWRLMERYDDVTTDLRVAFWSKPTPGLPYIAAPGVDVVSLRAAIESALQQLTPTDRDALGIVGLERISPQLYLDMDDND